MPIRADLRSYRLYEADRHLGFHVVRIVALAAGERMVRAGMAEAAVDKDGATRCFILRRDRYAERAHRDHGAVVAVAAPVTATAEPTSTVFSRAEVQALAGTKFQHGRSLTARMTEEQRARRISRKNGRKLPTEDLVERATNKARVWMRIGGLLNEVKVVESACL